MPPRKTTPVIIDATESIDQERFSNAMTVMQEDATQADLIVKQHQAAVRAVAEKVGYQLPAECVDPDLIQRDIAANMRRTVEACLEMGRGLCVLKQACQHGEFIARLGVLSIEHSVAKRFMQAAAKFSNGATSHHFIRAVGSQSKLLELLLLDDDQAEELQLTGETGELSLDDVASMSVKELRQAVRQLREEGKAKEDRLTTRAKKIAELEEKLEVAPRQPADEKSRAIQVEVSERLDEARCVITGNLTLSIKAACDHYIANGGDQPTAFLAGVVGQLQADINALRERFFLPDVAPDLIPAFAKHLAANQG